MAIRNILKEEDPALRKKSRVVDKFDERLAILLDDMRETLTLAQGAGLAAPQVGVLRRAVLVDMGPEQGLVEMVNPEILEPEGEQCEIEGCLSIPDVWGTVKRPEKVKVKAVTRGGEPFEFEAEGMYAIACCHEVDHLDGILFRDRVIEYVDIEDQE